MKLTGPEVPVGGGSRSAANKVMTTLPLAGAGVQGSLLTAAGR
jgi:hypothetical protein